MRTQLWHLFLSVAVGSGFVLLSAITYSHRQPEPVPAEPERISLLFMGDIMQHDGQIAAAYVDSLQGYSYDSCFKYVAPLIREADFAMANFEFTLGGKPYRGYPQFSAPDIIVRALKYAGIDLVGTANNHSCDRGRKGIERTIRILDSMQLEHTGTFVSRASRDSLYPFILRKNGFRLAILNYTYGTNGIVVPEPNVVNLIDTVLMAADLKRAADSLPDKVMVFIHWGDEYKSLPNAFQKSVADFCLRHGADYIVGMHPHVVQPTQRFMYPDSNGREVVVAWSLGNFISNQRDRYKDGGQMFSLGLIRENGKVNIESCGHYLTWVNTPYENGKKQFYILPVSEFEQDSSRLSREAYDKMMVFATDSRNLFSKENKGCYEYLLNMETRVWEIQK